MVRTKEDHRKYTCYAIQCNANKKVYIGVTYRPESRIYQHFLQLRKGNHPQSEFQKDFDFYGPKGFTVFTVEENIPHDEHLDREMAYTLEYRSYDPEFGYNRYTKKIEAAVHGYFDEKKGKPPKAVGL